MTATWKVVLAFLGVFVGGAIFGGFFALRVTQYVSESQGPQRIVREPPLTPGRAPLATQLLRRFAERLELTPEQREKLSPIIQQAEEEIAALRQTSLEQTETILRRVQRQVRAELTPEQQRRLNRMQAAQNEAVRRERLRRQRERQEGMSAPARTAPELKQGEKAGDAN